MGDFEQGFQRNTPNRSRTFYLTNEIDTFSASFSKKLLCQPRLFAVICNFPTQSDTAFCKPRPHHRCLPFRSVTESWRVEAISRCSMWIIPAVKHNKPCVTHRKRRKPCSIFQIWKIPRKKSAQSIVGQCIERERKIYL